MKVSALANSLSANTGVVRAAGAELGGSGHGPVRESEFEKAQAVGAVGDTALTGGKTGNGQGEEVTEMEADRRMKSVVDQVNEKVKHTGNRQLAFSYNENTKRISIKVYDALTKEIIREIPPEKTLEMLERIYDIAGIMVDEKR